MPYHPPARMLAHPPDSRRRENTFAFLSPMKQIPNPRAANFGGGVIVACPCHHIPTSCGHRGNLRHGGTRSSRGGSGNVGEDLATHCLSSVPIDLVSCRAAASGIIRAFLDTIRRGRTGGLRHLTAASVLYR